MKVVIKESDATLKDKMVVPGYSISLYRFAVK